MVNLTEARRLKYYYDSRQPEIRQELLDYGVKAEDVDGARTIGIYAGGSFDIQTPFVVELSVVRVFGTNCGLN